MKQLAFQTVDTKEAHELESRSQSTTVLEDEISRRVDFSSELTGSLGRSVP